MFVHLGFWTRFCGSICAGQRAFDAGSRSGGGATRRVRAVCGRFSRLGGASVDVSVTFRKLVKIVIFHRRLSRFFRGVAGRVLFSLPSGIGGCSSLHRHTHNPFLSITDLGTTPPQHGAGKLKHPPTNRQNKTPQQKQRG